jgi:hypothetical protein
MSAEIVDLARYRTKPKRRYTKPPKRDAATEAYVDFCMKLLYGVDYKEQRRPKRSRRRLTPAEPSA